MSVKQKVVGLLPANCSSSVAKLGGMKKRDMPILFYSVDASLTSSASSVWGCASPLSTLPIEPKIRRNRAAYSTLSKHRHYCTQGCAHHGCCLPTSHRCAASCVRPDNKARSRKPRCGSMLCSAKRKKLCRSQQSRCTGCSCVVAFGKFLHLLRALSQQAATPVT